MAHHAPGALRTVPPAPAPSTAPHVLMALSPSSYLLVARLWFPAAKSVEMEKGSPPNVMMATSSTVMAATTTARLRMDGLAMVEVLPRGTTVSSQFPATSSSRRQEPPTWGQSSFSKSGLLTCLLV